MRQEIILQGVTNKIQGVTNIRQALKNIRHALKNNVLAEAPTPVLPGRSALLIGCKDTTFGPEMQISTQKKQQ